MSGDAKSRPSAVEQGEREAFEYWGNVTMLLCITAIDWDAKRNCYREARLHDMWKAWQARATRQAVPSDKVLAEPSVAEKYNELLFAVGFKHQGESRHQTALRYIRQAEQGDPNAMAKVAAANTEPGEEG
jgi:hypothetical protein